MITKKESLQILLAIISISLALSLFRGLDLIPTIALSVFFVILINVLAKKISAFYLESEIEFESWKIERFGERPSQRFNKPFLAGLIFPIITSIISLGNFVWMSKIY